MCLLAKVCQPVRHDHNDENPEIRRADRPSIGEALHQDQNWSLSAGLASAIRHSAT